MINLSQINWLDFIGLYIYIAGLIFAMGALVIIETHGFFGRKSPYWNEATIRTHKITKPWIWIGLFTALLGALIFYRHNYRSTIVIIQGALLIPLILNGFFLSFWVSPRLIEREKEGRARELLPKEWRKKITISFFVSIIGWWSELFLLVLYLFKK